METNSINSRAAGYAAYTGAARAARQEGAAKTAANTGAAGAQRTRDVFEMSDEELRDAMTLRPGEDGQYHASKEHAAAGLERTRRDLVNKYGESQSSSAQKINDDFVSSAAKYIDRLDRSDKAQGTTFLSNFEAGTVVLFRVTDVIKDYYSDAHKETMQFSGGDENKAVSHIRDKYINANSAYFRSDLTAEQRDFAYRQENAMICENSKTMHANFALNDPYALKSIGGPMTEEKMDMWANQIQRNQIDGELQKLFESHGEKLPAGQSIKFSVNPYDYNVEVEGLEDGALAGALRKLLNQGQNGRALYSMIFNSDPSRLGFEQPEQFAALNREKITLFHMVKDLTGLDVRTLDRKDGTFLTPDGKDLWNAMLEGAKNYKNDDGSRGVSIDGFKDIYQKYAREGWGGNESLSIEYKDGHLYDIGTRYGYGPGQTDWQADLINNAAKIAQRNMARVDAAAQELEVQGRDDENAARMA